MFVSTWKHWLQDPAVMAANYGIAGVMDRIEKGWQWLIFGIIRGIFRKANWIRKENGRSDWWEIGTRHRSLCLIPRIWRFRKGKSSYSRQGFKAVPIVFIYDCLKDISWLFDTILGIVYQRVEYNTKWPACLWLANSFRFLKIYHLLEKTSRSNVSMWHMSQTPRVISPDTYKNNFKNWLLVKLISEIS